MRDPIRIRMGNVAELSLYDLMNQVEGPVTVTGVVGRDREMAAVAAFLDAVPAGPAGLLLEGAAGIGKSTVWSAGAAWAGAVALSAAIVLLGLVIVIAVLVQGRRDRAHDLILDGDESLPIAGVQRERRRLAAPRTQRLMARTIDGVVEQALNPPRICPRGARPLFKIAVVASVADDLHAISRALRAEHGCIQGVVLAERLLSDGQSPLYGDQARLLREELHRIQKAL